MITFLCRSRPATAAAFLLTAAASAGMAQTASPATAAAGVNEPLMLSEFTVTTSQDKGYAATNSTTASRINENIRDIPQAVFVVTDELLKDFAVYDLGDALQYVPGVENLEGPDEAYSIRGFRNTHSSENGMTRQRQEPTENAYAERIEVLLGPASVLYGESLSAGGGIVNIIPKRPQFKSFQQLSLRYTSDDQLYATIDHTDRVGGSEKFAYRLIGTVTRWRPDIDRTSNDRFFLRGSLLFRPGKNTQVVFDVEGMHQRIRRGERYDYVRNGRIIQIPDNVNPMDDRSLYDNDSQALRNEITHKFNERWNLRSGFVASKKHFVRDQIVPAGAINPDERTINRGPSRRADRTVAVISHNVDVAAKNFVTGPVKHSWVFGIDNSLTYIPATGFRYTSPGPFDLFAPVYNSPEFVNQTTTAKNDSRLWQHQGFVATTFRVFQDRLALSYGHRANEFKQIVRNSLAGTKTIFDGETVHTDRYGASFAITRDVSIYYSTSEAFKLVSTVNPDGSRRPPTRGDTEEAGVKAGFMDNRLSFTAAAYRATELDRLQNVPGMPGFQAPTGAIESSGVDLGFVWVPLENLQMIGGYSRLKGEVAGDADEFAVGNERFGLPKHKAKLWIKYVFTETVLRGLGVGGGFNYVSEKSISNSLPIPAYTRYDLHVSYRPRGANWDIQLNVDNVTDERYYTSGNANRFTVGSDRVFKGTVNYRF